MGAPRAAPTATACEAALTAAGRPVASESPKLPRIAPATPARPVWPEMQSSDQAALLAHPQ